MSTWGDMAKAEVFDKHYVGEPMFALDHYECTCGMTWENGDGEVALRHVEKLIIDKMNILETLVTQKLAQDMARAWRTGYTVGYDKGERVGREDCAKEHGASSTDVQ